MLLNMESGYHIVTIRVIWTSWAHIWLSSTVISMTCHLHRANMTQQHHRQHDLVAP
jgi:hypothetical protein